MGTMLQAADPSMDDFQGLEGCNEILSVTRPDVVAAIHRAYFAAGSDCVETNTFGANLSALAEYDIPERIHELAEAGARVARQVADEVATEDRPRWVLGSVGPGTKLPSLGQIGFRPLRDGYQACVEGLLTGGAHGIQIETSQDLLQTRASVIGAKRAMAALGLDVPLMVSVTVETTGTMLVGSEIGAALVALEPLGIDVIGLNCATGPAEMSEHLRYLSRYARIGVSCMPNAGLPELTPTGARYPLGPEAFTKALAAYVHDYGLSLVGGCCGTTPEHIKAMIGFVKSVAPRHVAQFAAQPARVEPQTPVPLAERSAFGAKLARGAFITTVEIVPPKGVDPAPMFEQVRELKAAGVDAVNVPDGPRAQSRMGAQLSVSTIPVRASASSRRASMARREVPYRLPCTSAHSANACASTSRSKGTSWCR